MVSRSAALGIPAVSSIWDETEAETSQQESFIPLHKPASFTRAKVDAVERRPAAVLNLCQFLNTLSAQCKADISRLGCARPHHHHHNPDDKGAAEQNKHHHHYHGIREPWEKRMLRLKVYQRAFSAIVMYFKAYSPALFYIKKTYEDMLNYRINQIKHAHFEKKRIHIQKHVMKEQMNTYQFPEYPQLFKAEKYLSILRHRIALQEDAIKVITGILTKMEQALSDHFERHRDLEEQIIMIDNEIASRRQKAYTMREKEEKEGKEKDGPAVTDNTVDYIDSDEEEPDDPYLNAEDVDEERRMVWIMAFAICHKDLEDAERKLALFQTKYQHVVPRQEHENMKRSIKDEKVLAKSLADDRSALEDELANLVEMEEKLTEELEEIKGQLTELRLLVTPRPSYETLGEFIQGGLPKWEKMIQGKSTKEVTEKLFTELRSRRGGDKFLQPLGIEKTVPRCLRHGNRVIDRQLHFRDAALLINDIWMSRKHALDENFNAPPRTENEFEFEKPDENLATKSFADFVALYFENMYADVEQRMEWSYNLIECCKRFSRDYRLTLFLNILQGKSDENVYYTTRTELFRVRNTFLQKSADENMTKGMLNSNQFVEALELTFPNKLEQDVQAIVRVTNKLNAELNQYAGADLSTYHVTQLIDVRDDGFRGAFVSELVKQFEVSRQTFIDQIIEALANILDISPTSAANENDPAADRDINHFQVYQSVKKVDDGITDDALGALLAWIFTGTSAVHGSGISTSRLINYIKMHVDDAAGSTVQVGNADNDAFERAIKDILRNDENENDEQQVSEAQKKAFYKALRQAKLRTVVKRLKGSALMPSWQNFDPTDSDLPEAPIDIDVHLGVDPGGRKKTFINKSLAPNAFELAELQKFGGGGESEGEEDEITPPIA
ncbi:Translin-associated factor X-interacting protein 1 [Orchesella cincta]|uniref:Translin-associated factor X-interacting protein 1 n=1 Tax=Orchesella cincta TaxID=48709 RepID=A0A1D2MU79_ORCCI|nr:Translin-associated factor X-interacting protein 1 [Orchesella cincta]